MTGRDTGGRDPLRDDRDSRGSTRPNSHSDGRGSQGKREPLPAVRPRQSRAKRDGDGDWPSTEWDELSDVDYWAELASDKPITTTAQPAGGSARSDRTEPRRAKESGSGRHDRHDRQGGNADRAPAAKLPIRAPRQHEPDFPSGPGGRHSGSGGRGNGAGGRSDEFSGVGARRPGQAADEQATAMLAGRSGWTTDDGGFRPPVIADDDPLTSPSFPKISDDSRSYRRSRADGPDRGSTPPGGYPRPDRSRSDYPAPSPDPYQSVPSSTSAPQGYPIPLASPTPAARSTDSYPPPASGYPVQGAAGYASAGYQGSTGYQDNTVYQDNVYQDNTAATAPYPMPPGPAGYVAGQASAQTSGPHVRPVDVAYPPLPEASSPHHSISQPSQLSQAPLSQAPLSQQTAGYPPYPPGGYAGDPAGYQAPGIQPSPLPALPAGGYGAAPSQHSTGQGQPAQHYSVPSYPVPTIAEPNFAGTSYSMPTYATPTYATPSEPSGYPPASQEPAGYAGSDPYAVDPYGYPGYGAGGH